MIEISDIRSLYPFKSNFIKVKGYNYHYLDEGQGEAPLVMLHGNPSWSFMYRNLVRELSAKRRVIAPDHLGCGLSDKPQDFHYRLETHIDNLESLLLNLQLKNITLIVHDWGGAVGMGFAVRHPRLIDRLVILNSAAFSMDWLPFRLGLMRLPWLDDKLIRSLNLFVRASLRMTTEKRLSLQVKEGYRMPYQTYEDRIAILRFVQDIPLNPQHVSYEVLLEIEHALWMFRESPVCLVWGMKDWCFAPLVLDRWKLYYPQAEVNEINHAGHYLLEDAGDEITGIIQRFLER